MAFNWVSCLKITLLFFLIAAIATAFRTLPVEQTLKDFLLWVKQDIGPWGPLVLGMAYIPLTVLAVPASILIGFEENNDYLFPYILYITKMRITICRTRKLGGGYLLGLPVGFIADSIGATVGAAAAFLLGRTIGRSFVVSKLNDYPQFQAVAIATQKLGFMILFLLRLVRIIPFNMLNYALSVTPIPLGKYILASWLGKMPVALALVYIGTTLKDLSDVTHGWHDFSKAHWDALEKALAEKDDIDSIVASPEQPIVADPTADLHQPHMITIDHDNHEN